MENLVLTENLRLDLKWGMTKKKERSEHLRLGEVCERLSIQLNYRTENLLEAINPEHP